MYVHPAFQADRGASLAFAAARSFGLVTACAGARPLASPLPFHLHYADDGTPLVTFHVARANPLASRANCAGQWLISVMGADAYVSPDWYASPDQVPTWLYQTVQLSGPVEPLPYEALASHLDSLSETFEAQLAPKALWHSRTVTPARRKMLMKAIVALEMRVESVEGNFKLNQHKSDADHVAVATHLRSLGDAGAREVSNAMVALRPQLNYEPADAAA
jgi:transcriptional regulator